MYLRSKGNRFIKGFTLMEVLVVIALLVIVMLTSTPYLFGTREKAILQREKDKITNYLKLAQQNSIAAYHGETYGLSFPGTNRFTTTPDGTLYQLANEVRISSVSPSSISFEKLTGLPSAGLTLTLVSRYYQTTITVSSLGTITSTIVDRL